jgi:hypothetical protein
LARGKSFEVGALVNPPGAPKTAISGEKFLHSSGW